MSLPLHLLADHGDLLSALPFAGPAIVVFLGLIGMVARDRLGPRP